MCVIARAHLLPSSRSPFGSVRDLLGTGGSVFCPSPIPSIDVSVLTHLSKKYAASAVLMKLSSSWNSITHAMST